MKEKIIKECVRQHERGNTWFSGSAICFLIAIGAIVYKILEK